MKVSVIIPAKNAEASLSEAVKSALDQSGVSLEVIVVDDGSVDGTAAVVGRLREKGEKLTVISNPKSLGVSAARNQAIAASRGEWIAVLDADDEFLPGRLSRMVEEAERRRLDMLADNLRLRSETSADLGVAFEETDLDTFGSISLEIFALHDIPRSQPMGIGFCKPIVRKRFLEQTGVRYKNNIACAEDFLFYCECLLSGARFGFSPYPGYLYTVRTGGHGTAFNLQASQVNRIIMESARKQSPSSLAILRRRQHAIDYDGFAKSVRAKRYDQSLKFLWRMSPLFLAQRMAELMKRKVVALIG